MHVPRLAKRLPCDGLVFAMRLPWNCQLWQVVSYAIAWYTPILAIRLPWNRHFCQNVCHMIVLPWMALKGMGKRNA